ncbi:MAG: electron transfer flavoprotein subunit alpha/FixB family protein, partial [Bdellovibrionales bacterium]|nr:electron transfer flavoprotein subunit alpha/FixB family protein [Bdellovibrionales bacterium]
MSILVYLENAGAELPKGALCTIVAALQAKSAQGHDKAVGLILGNEGADAAANVAAAYGLDEVLYVQNAGLDPYLAIPHAEAIVAAAQECGASLVIGLSSTRGKDVMPRVAQVLDAGQASDVLEFLSEGKFKRPMYAGDIIATVEITTDKKVTTVRQTAFDPAEKSGSSCSVRALQVALSGTDAQKFVAFDTVESERPELTEADIVVSGGRAMKSEENFEKYIAPLADALGAAIGASRAAVDSGYAPNDWQVGQT